MQDAAIELQLTGKIEEIESRSSRELRRAIAVARQKGASSWVSAMPNEEHGTVLHKKDFLDAVYIRYGWPIMDLPTTCTCGDAFSVQHSLDCLLGGFRTLQHNEVRDLVADCLREARFPGVEVEPQLQPLSGESFKLKTTNTDEDARSDVKCVGF